MSESKPSASQADELGRKLQTALAQRRPRPWKLVLALLALGTLFLLLLAWWLYPQPRPEPLQVLALHAVFAIGETPVARAQLILPAEDEGRGRLSGQTIVFTQPRPILAQGEKPREIVATSDALGQASINWPVAPPAPMTEFLVRYINVSQRQQSPFDRGRLYVWPSEAPILIVDADETLIADRLAEKAGKALHQAQAAGWRIAYLAPASSQAQDFRTACGSIESDVNLPKGPVLGRTHYPGEDTVDSVRRGILKSLKEQFKGPLVAVVKSVEAARVCRDVRVDVIMIGDAALDQAPRVPAWADVPTKLKK